MLELSRFLYVDAILAGLLADLITLSTSLFTMNVYGHVVLSRATITLWVLAVDTCLAFVSDLILKMLRGICLDTAGKRSDPIISSILFEHIIGMEMKKRPAHAGSLAQNTHELQSLCDFLSSLTLAAIIDLSSTLLLLIVIGIIGDALTWIPVLTLPIVLLCSQALQRPANAAAAKTMNLTGKRRTLLVEALSNLDTIKANDAQSERRFQQEQMLGSLSHLELRMKTLSGLTSNLTD